MSLKICTLTIMLLGTIAAFGQSSEQPDRIILKLKNEAVTESILYKQQGTSSRKVDNISQRFNATKTKRMITGKRDMQFVFTVQFPKGTDLHSIIEEYLNTGEVEYAEPDYQVTGAGMQGITPNDQYYYRQWSHKNDGSFILAAAVPGADIDMEDAWSMEQGDSNIVVGIIDSGTKLDHPDLAGRIWTNYNEIPGNGTDDDGNGLIDDVNAWDFVNDDNNPTDDYGHGTNLAGIIGANGNNSTGYAGVDWNCKLMILKGLDNNNSGAFSWFSQAIYYAVDNGVKVINLSIGTTSLSNTFHNAVNFALNNNVTVVASMMNYNNNLSYYPAAYPGVIAVGSTNPNDERSVPFFWSSSSGSNYGTHISVVAPGNYIYGLQFQSNTNYNTYWCGTSQSAPLVTGLVSLLLAQDSTRTPAQIKSIIESTAEDEVGNPSEDLPGWDEYYGYGRINAYNALSVLTSNESIADHPKTFSVFPNPAREHFTVEFSPGAKQIKVFNAIGELIEQRFVSGQTTQEFQLKEPGIYFVELDSEKYTDTKKVVVVK